MPRCAPLPLWISQGLHVVVGFLLWGPCCGKQTEPLVSLKQGSLWGCIHPCSWAGSVQHTLAGHWMRFISAWNGEKMARRCDKNISRESGNVGKPFYLSIVIVHQKLTGERGTKIRSAISLFHTRRPPFLSLDFSAHSRQICWFRNIFRTTADKLRLTDYTQVFCLNSRPYSGTSSFYCITVSSLTIKRMKMYTNHFNWFTGCMMTLTTDVCLITTWHSCINVLVNISPHFIPGNPSIQTQSPEVDKLGVGTACWYYQDFAYAANWWSGRKLF